MRGPGAAATLIDVTAPHETAGHYWDLSVAGEASTAGTLAWVRGCLERCFPAERGYAHEERELRGPVEGRALVVRKGPWTLRCSVLALPARAPGERPRHRIVVVVRHGEDGVSVRRARRARWAAPAALLAGGGVVAGTTALLGALVAGQGAMGLALVEWAAAAGVGALAGALATRSVFGRIAPGAPPAVAAGTEPNPLPRIVAAIDAVARARALPPDGGFRRSLRDPVTGGPLRRGRPPAPAPVALPAPARART